MEGAAEKVMGLVREGIKVFHLVADMHGCERRQSGDWRSEEGGERRGRHIKDVLREVHGRLVKEGMRDEITLIVGGGIALAEHMAKAIICGADLVAVDVPLLVALGCRVCGHVAKGMNEKQNGSSASMLLGAGGAQGENVRENTAPRSMAPGNLCAATGCPAGLETLDVGYAAQRMVNLMGAWHSQLIEVLGAMGIREIRRLRGEVGRAMFLEDLEKEAFGDLVRK
jgi:glutamate synthase domain-containing protein 2